MEERISRKKFMRLGAAIGVTAAGASVVAACGGSGSESGATPPSGTTSSVETGGGEAGGTTGSGSSGKVIAQASEVPQNSAKKFTSAGQPAVLVHLQSGDFVAYSAVCTHQQCIVDYQQRSSQLVCPCHGSIFDPSQGAQVVSGPAPTPLPEVPIKVQGSRITEA